MMSSSRMLPTQADSLIETKIIQEDDLNIRLDKLLAQSYPHYSRTYFQTLIEKGLVLINGSPFKKKDTAKVHDEIEICFELLPESNIDPENLSLEILYEDDHIIAVNKPAGMVTHPAPGHYSGTFVNGLLYHCKSLAFNDKLRPGIVHRLDKDTTGVLIAAKTTQAHQGLVASFAERSLKKTYLALCVGSPGIRTIKAPIRRHPTRYQQMIVAEDGKFAVSHCKEIISNETVSLVEIDLITGRTHQIRVHFQSIAHPILGDPIYGSPKWNQYYQLSRQMLHAFKLSFVHPVTKKNIELTAPLPLDFLQLAQRLKLDSPLLLS